MSIRPSPVAGRSRLATRWIGLIAGGAMLAVASPLRAQTDTTVRLADGAVVDITLRTGRLLVRGIDGRSGTVRATGGDYALRSSGVALVVAPRPDDGGARRPPAPRTLELEVPRGVRVVVSTVAADVEVRGIAGSVEVRSTSGRVQVLEARGRVIAETISGDVATSGPTALTRLTTVSGDVRVREATGEVDVRTTSGDISVSGTGITRFAAETMSGEVHVDGLFEAAARAQIGTHSGDITLRVPDGISGQVTFSTVHGELTAGRPITLLPDDGDGRRRGRRTWRYRIGPAEGTAPPRLQLDLTTFTGDVRLVHAPRS